MFQRIDEARAKKTQKNSPQENGRVTNAGTWRIWTNCKK